MKPLTANLKHFYQCRPLYVWYIMWGFFCLSLVFATLADRHSAAAAGVAAATGAGVEAGTGEFMFFLVCLAAYFAANLACDVMSRPFVFALPGHSAVAGKILLGVGAVLVPTAGLAYFYLVPASDGAGGAEALCGLSVAAAAYLFGVALVLGSGWSAQVASLLPAALIIAWSLRVPSHLGAVLLPHPWGASVLALAASGLLLPWCSPARCARRVCGQPWIGLVGAWNRAKALRVEKERLARKIGDRREAGPLWVEQALLPGLARHGAATLARDVWGEAFAITSRCRLADVSRALLFVAANVALFGLWSGLFSPTESSPAGSGHLSHFESVFANIPIFFVPLLFARLRGAFFSTQLLASGRRERFRREMVVAGLLFVAVSGATVLIVLLCRGLFPMIPPYRVGAYTLAPRAPDLWAVSVLLWGIPACLMSRLVVLRRVVALLGLVGGVLVGAAFFWFPLFANLPAASIVAIGLGFWALYVAVAWRTAMRKDLPTRS